MANSSSRNGTKVRLVVVHTAEGVTKASDLRAYFDRSTNSSAHAVADDATLLDNLVDYSRAAWTLRNGNPYSDNLELCGFAAWTRAQWVNEHDGMLHQAANWIRSRCAARGIPLRKLTPAQVGQGMSGVCGHVDYTNGTGDGTHWDPGPGFPWDIVLAYASGGGGSSTRSNNTVPDTKQEEDTTMIIPAAEDDYVSIPCNGATSLYISTAYSRKVKILGIAAVKDNNGQGTAAYATAPTVPDQLETINPDQPGPIAIGPGCRVVQLRYSADHAFTAWCA